LLGLADDVNIVLAELSVDTARLVLVGGAGSVLTTWSGTPFHTTRVATDPFGMEILSTPGLSSDGLGW